MATTTNAYEDPRWLDALRRRSHPAVAGTLAHEDPAATHGTMPLELVQLYLRLEAEHGSLAYRIAPLAAQPTPFHSRAEVGLRPPRAAYTMISPEGITVHWGGPSLWSAGFDHARCAAIWRAWQSFHMDDPDRLWNDIAYTSGVCPHGDRYEGRPADARTAANGTNEGNAVSEATVYIGGAGDAFTDAAKAGFVAESARLGHPLRWPHRHWTDTDCPGDVEAAWVAAGAPGPVPAPVPIPVPVSLEDDMLIINVKDRGIFFCRGEKSQQMTDTAHVAPLVRAGVKYIDTDKDGRVEISGAIFDQYLA